MKKIFYLIIVLIMFFLSPIDIFATGDIFVSTLDLYINKGETNTFTITANDSAGRVDIISLNPSIVDVSEEMIFLDMESKTITVNGLIEGTTTIKVYVYDAVTSNYDDLSGKTYIINVHVIIPITEIKLNNINLKINEQEKLFVELFPTNATEVISYNWTSSNNNIVNVDNNGNITAKNIGKAIITVTSSKGFTTSCEVTVSNYLKGDINKDSNITITDVIKLLRVYLSLDEETSDTLVTGDMNEDSSITITDIIKLLRVYLSLE